MDSLQLQEAAKQKTGANKQDYGQCDFADDEEVT